jgi:hypothetical protein
LSEDDDEGTDIEHSLDTDEQENSEPDISDPYDKVYTNVPSESHMLPVGAELQALQRKEIRG